MGERFRPGPYSVKMDCRRRDVCLQVSKMASELILLQLM